MKHSFLSIAKGIMAFTIISSTCFFSCKKDGFKGKYAEAQINATKQDTIVQGLMKLFEQPDGSVKMELDLYVPIKANQSVAVHLHEHGMCGNFGSDAHGHWNPTGAQHGQWGSASFHSGDIGNIALDANGRGKLEIITKLWSIGGSDNTNILDRGVIVHSGVDDYTSQPAGNSGTRIGCGVIEQK